SRLTEIPAAAATSLSVRRCSWRRLRIRPPSVRRSSARFRRGTFAESTAVTPQLYSGAAIDSRDLEVVLQESRMVATRRDGWHDRAVRLLDRLREALERAGLEQALLCHPESVAHLSGFSEPAEDWPVANPFVAGPPLLAVTASSATLVIPDFYAGHVGSASLPHVAYRAYD